MSKQKTMLTFDQRLDLADWLRTPGNPEKVRECPADAQAIAVAAQDLPWLTEDYLSAFRNLRKKLGVRTGHGEKTRAKKAAAKRVKETQESLEERVDKLEEMVQELEAKYHKLHLDYILYQHQDGKISRNVVHEVFGLPTIPDLPEHLRVPQCSTQENN